MADQLRGIGNLWLNGTLIRNGVQYLIRFEQHGIMDHISGSIDVDPCGDGAALIDGLREAGSEGVGLRKQ
jgi:hypothetical protein